MNLFSILIIYMTKVKVFTNKELKSLIRQYKSKDCKSYSKLDKKGLIDYILKVKKLRDVYNKLQSKTELGKKNQSQLSQFLEEPEALEVEEAPVVEVEPEPKSKQTKSKMTWTDALKKYAVEIGKYIIPKKNTTEYARVKAIQMGKE
jgi:hypothetical protein